MLTQIETSNRILQETIGSIVASDRRAPVDVKVCDFDGAQYWVRTVRAAEGGDAAVYDMLVVSLAFPVYKQVCALGAEQDLQDTCGDLLVKSDDGSDVMLRIDLAAIPPAHMQDLVSMVSRLKEKVGGAPFKKYFSALAAKETLEPATFSQHEDCPVFIVPKHDRVVIVFALNVKERADQVVTSVFLTEFAEARRKVPSGPIVTFTIAPPKEIQDAFAIQDARGNVGFLSFAMLPHHVDTPAKIAQAAAIFSGFRTYVQYHIKCSKAYFHSRMRAKVVSLLKVLNRAKNDQFDDGKEKKKKTFSGRTFEQK